MARFQCPGCQKQFDVSDEHLGRVVGCPHCGEPLATVAPLPGGPPVGAGWPAPGPGGFGPPGMVFVPSQPPRAGNRPGLFSFLLGLLYWLGAIGAGVAMFVSRVGSEMLTADRREEIQRDLAENPPVWHTALTVVLVIVALVGLVLGIYAATRPNRKKGLAITGIVLCSLAMCCGLVGLLASVANIE